MKKIWAAVAAVCLGAALLLPIAACGDDNGGSLEYSTPTGGSGYGEYDVDRTVENGQKTNNINMPNFDPYKVGEGKYAVTVHEADGKVYFAFGAGKTGIFSVASAGDADTCVTQLIGNLIGGLRNLGGEYRSDNISADDKNFKYEFKCDQSDMRGAGGVLYFEIGISDPASAGKPFDLIFKYEREYIDDQPTYETTVISALEEFKSFETPAGKTLLLPGDDLYDVNFTPVLGKDGYYHKGSADGPLLYALVKSPAHPFNLDVGFDYIKNEVDAGNFFFSDGKTYSYNYVSFLEKYIEHANSDGLYPCTEEFSVFLSLYLARNVNVADMKTELMISPPAGYEWLAGCGFYE